MSDNVKGFTFLWELVNFSMLPHQCGEKLHSNTFVVDQLKNTEYYLSLFPRGGLCSGGYISIYLYPTLNSKDIDLKLTFSLTIVSTEPSSDKSIIFENRTIRLGYGHSKFMRLDKMYAKNQLYLPNDTLTVRCYLNPVKERPEETNEAKYVPNVLRSCKSRTSIEVHRRSNTLHVSNIKELIKHLNNTAFILETALTKYAGLKITLNFTELANKDFVKIEIRQIRLPFEKEPLFVKCKMTVVSARKKYQDSNESTHLFQMSLDDIWHFPEFVKISNLTRDKYLYLDDTLLLQCDFAFSCSSAVYHLENDCTPLTFETKDGRNVGELVAKLEDLYESGQFCDVELRAGGETIPAHKVVLCAASPVFRAMFENDSKEKDSSVVEIEDVDPDTLRRMLAFVHSEALKEDLSFEHASKLFSAADKYDLETMRRRCSIVLVSSLSVESVCDVLVLADAHQNNFLLTAVYNFIRSHPNETFNSEHWKRFMGLNSKLSVEIMHRMLTQKQLL